MSITSDPLPEIPGKRYFTIGEVSELCDVKPHVLRYWEQEFDMLKPVKRRGNRRYYQQQDVVLVRKIRHLLYGQGYTISGARTQLATTSDNQEARPGGKILDGITLRAVIAELEDISTSLKS